MKLSKEEKTEKKALKKYDKEKINHKVTEILPFVKAENDCFLLNTGKYVDFLQIICQDLMSESEDGCSWINYQFEKFYKSYGEDFKIIGINYPTDTNSQQAFLLRKLENTTNTIHRNLIELRLQEEVEIQKTKTDREYYFMFFFKNLEERKEKLPVIINQFTEGLVRELPYTKKEQILFKLINKNASINVTDEPKMPRLEIIDNYVKEVGYDPYLISRIQPQGGITWKNEKFTSTGSGYEACLHLYKYRRHIDRFWLNPILNIKNIISVLDISTENKEDVLKNLNRSMSEQDSRISSARDRRELNTAQRQLSELDQLFREVDALDEIVKLVHIRVFCAEATKEELDKKIATIEKSYEGKGFKAAVFLDEGKAEWQSQFLTYEEQKKNEYSRYGQAITSHNFAEGNPFYFSSLNDPFGQYLGYTINCGGMVNYDQFHIDDFRTYYNSLILGLMGSGKSTLIKKLLELQAAIGNFIRGFDIKGEYTGLIKYLGGKIVYLDGTHGRLNLLEILASCEDNESTSYIRHISKLRAIYKFLAPESDVYEGNAFEEVLRELYAEWNLTPESGKQITGLEHSAYPTFSNLLEVIDKKVANAKKVTGKMEQEVELLKITRLINVQDIIKNTVREYGYIFDGITSIDDIYNEQIVFFNVQELAKVKEEIFNAQVFNAISLCWDNCVRVGTEMKNLFDNREIDFADIKRFMIFIDECHHFVTPTNLPAVHQMVLYQREARSAFGGLVLADQTVRDFIPDGTSDAGIREIQTLFELTQYKFIMRQDSNNIDVLAKAFNGQITNNELMKIPRLKKGDCIFSISGYKNLHIHIDVSEDELKLFAGGA